MIQKIAYITNSRLPTEKAHGHQIIRMCQEFANQNIQMRLIWPRRKNIIKDNIFSYYQAKKNFEASEIFSPDFIQYAKVLKKLSFWLQSFSFLIRLGLLSIEKETYIFTRRPEIAYLFKLRGFKVAYECHDWFNKSQKVSLWLLRKVDRIITTNNFIKAEFLKNSVDAEKILVCPNGVDLDKFAVDISKVQALSLLPVKDLEAKKVLMYTGSFKTMNIGKGVDEILESLKLLNNNSLFFVAIGGSQKQIQEYTKIAEKLQVKDQVTFLEPVNQEELGKLQQVADVMLMPFPDKAHYRYFMTPLKMFEYMASKKPIIASNLPSIKEILNDENAFFCQTEDVISLANMIKYVLTHEIEAGKKANQAFIDVQQYGWDKRVQNIIKFLEV